MSDRANVNDTTPTISERSNTNNGLDLASLADLHDVRKAQIAMTQAPERVGNDRPQGPDREAEAAKRKAAEREAELKSEEKLPEDVKKDRASLRQLAVEMDKTGKLDTKVLADIINKNIKNLPDDQQRKAANDLLGIVSRASDKYQLSIQGMGKNMMIYRAAIVPKEQSALLPLPGVEINDRQQRVRQRGVR